MENGPIIAAAASSHSIPAHLPESTERRGRFRLDSIDLLRGLVMVIMALDHTRDFLSPGGGEFLRDPHHPALFLTRWITNFCAPTFVFLAGVGAFLYASRSGSKSMLSRFLLTRGAWLIFCELTVIRIGWTFNLLPNFLVLQVIWAIGWSMIGLAGMVYAPRAVLAVLTAVVILGHNLLDGVHADKFGPFSPLWLLLHQRGLFSIGPHAQVFALYPLIPWLAVMWAGYLFGPVFLLAPERRRRWLWTAGAISMLLFVGLRSGNWYGDPTPWAPQNPLWASILSFVNVEKYPPSLLFLAVTLGPALLALAAFDQARGPVARFFITFGRVPFFFYVLHIYLIHLLSVAIAALVPSWTSARMIVGPSATPVPDLSLPGAYACWAFVVLTLFPFCRWFGQIKQVRKEWWLSYL